MTEIRDFSRQRRTEAPRFKIDDQVFEAIPEPPPAAVLEVTDVGDLVELVGIDPATATQAQLAKLQQGMRATQLKAVEFLDTVLTEESAQRFAELLRSKNNPVSFQQIQDIVQWLITEYGDRPTVPSKSSVNGLDGNGTSSTDIVPIGT